MRRTFGLAINPFLRRMSSVDAGHRTPVPDTATKVNPKRKRSGLVTRRRRWFWAKASQNVPVANMIYVLRARRRKALITILFLAKLQRGSEKTVQSAVPSHFATGLLSRFRVAH